MKLNNVVIEAEYMDIMFHQLQRLFLCHFV